MNERIYSINERWVVATFVVAGAVVFIAASLPGQYGGGLLSLEIESGHYYLINHNIKTEIAPQMLFWLYAWFGAGLAAFLPCLISGILLARQVPWLKWGWPISLLISKKMNE